MKINQKDTSEDFKLLRMFLLNTKVGYYPKSPVEEKKLNIILKPII